MAEKERTMTRTLRPRTRLLFRVSALPGFLPALLTGSALLVEPPDKYAIACLMSRDGNGYAAKEFWLMANRQVLATA